MNSAALIMGWIATTVAGVIVNCSPLLVSYWLDNRKNKK